MIKSYFAPITNNSFLKLFAKNHFPFLFVLFLYFLPLRSLGQTTLFQFNFENSGAPNIDNVTGVPVFSTNGVAGVAFTNTATPICQGAYMYTANTWNTGDYYRFAVNTTGFANMTFSFCNRTSNNNIGNFQVRVSADGGAIWNTVLATYTPTTTNSTLTTSTFPTVANNGAAVWIEIYKTNNADNNSRTYLIDAATLTGHAIPTITSFTPTSVCQGGSVVITGTNFTGATAVNFNGVAATYTINSDTQITATLPITATTGTITLTTPGGTATSTGSFTIAPANTVGVASSTPMLCINTALATAITHTTTGATGIGAATGLPAGVTASWASNTITINGTPTTSGTFNYSIPLMGGCGSVNATGTITAVNPATSAGTIAGTNVVCQGQSGVVYTVPAIANATAYIWTLPTGATIASGANTNSITVNYSTTASSGNITVLGSNSTCGNGVVSANYSVTVNPLPMAAGTISGTATVCQGNSGIGYSVPAITNATGYNWTLPTGATIVTGANTNAITVDFAANATSGNINVTGSNSSCNGAISANYQVTVNTLSIAPTSITGTISLCAGVSTTLTLSGGTAGTGAIAEWFSGSCGGTAEGTGNSITVTPGSTTTYYVRYNGTCNTTTCASVTVTVNPLPVAPGIPTSNSPQCVSTGVTITRTGSPIGGTNWYWQTSPTGTSSGAFGSTYTVFASGTYYIRALNFATGCWSAASSITVVVDPLPTIALSSPVATTNQTVCLNTPITTISYTVGGSATGATVTGLPTGVTGNFVAGVFNITGSPTATGTFNYTLTTNGTCTPAASATGIINVTALPVVTAPASLCLGSTSTLSPTTGGTWTSSNNTIATVTNAGLVTGLATGSVTFTFTQTSTGCSNTTSSVTINPLPLVPGTPTSNSPQCVTTGVTITRTGSPVGGTNWYWQTTPTGTSSGAFGPTYTVFASGTYYIRTYNFTTGCWSTASSITVVVNPLPVAPGAITGTTTVCQGQNGVTYTVPTISNASSYNWTLPTGATIASGSGTNTITVNYSTTAISGNITVTGTNACGNGLVSSNYAVTVNPLPIAPGTISGAATVCQGQNGVAYSVPAITYATGYTWTLPTGATIASGSGTNSITVNFSVTAVSGNISVLGTNACGNGVIANYPITVDPLPDAASTITGTTLVCQGQNGVIYTVPIIANATNYNWTLPTGALISAGAGTNMIAVDFGMTAVSGNITVQGTNACGNGVISANYPVIVNITPSITTNFSPTACSGEVITVSPINGVDGIVPAGTTFSWGLPTVTGGITGATALSGQTSFVQTLTNPTNVQQTASYNVSASTPGCSTNTFSVLVTLNPKPTVSGTPLTQSICSGSSIAPITLSNPNSITGTINYSWTRDNTTNVTGISSTGIGSSITGNLSNSTNIPQTTVFTVIATTQNGCNSLPFTVSVTVNPIPTVAAVPATQTICSENNITAITLSNPNNVTGTTYSWTRNNNVTITGIPDGTGTSITGSLTNTTNVAQTTIFTIKATAIGCDSTFTTVSVTVNPKPTFPASLTTQTVCSGISISPIVIVNPSGVAGTSYSWTRDNTTNLSGILSGSGSPISGTLVNNTNSDQTTIFTITATAGTCTSTTTTTVIVKPTPNIATTPSSQTKCNAVALTTIVISNPNNVAGTNFTWTRDKTTELTGIASSGSGTSITGTLTNTTTITQTATFTITATAINGCSSTSTATVTVYAPLVAPVIGDSQTACILATPDPLTIITPPTGGSGAYSYQWQRSTSASGPWTNVGTGGTTYNPPQLPLIGAQNYFYQLIITDLCGTVISNIISIEPVVNGSFTSSVSNYPVAAVCPATTFSPTITATLHLSSSAVRFLWSADSAFITPSTGGPTGTTSGITGIFFRTSTATLGPLTTQNNTNATVTTPISITPVVYEYPGPPSGNQLCSVSSQTIDIIIRPTPVAIAAVSNTTICNGSSTGIVINGNITDAVMQFSWVRNNTINVTGTASGNSGNITTPTNSFSITNNLTNTTAATQTVIYTITPTSNGCTGAPITVTIYVAPTVTAGTVITDQTICSGGDPAAFTQSVSATGLNLTYQWQSSTDNVSFSNISGANASTYDAPMGLTVTTWYRRVVTSTINGVTCTANSSAIKVTVNSLNPGSVAGAQTFCTGGDPIAFTSVAATGSGVITYQWESSTTDCNSGFSNITVNGTSAIYDIPSGLSVTTYYRRKAISTLNTVACNDYSNCITVSVNNVTPGTVGTNQTICGNNPDIFTVLTPATGSGVLTYQWQSNITGCGGTWANISGATNDTYDAPAGLLVTTYYRRITTSTLNGISCSANSNCITVTANNINPGVISGNRTICSGGDPTGFTETSAATGNGITYQWQYSTISGAGPWTNITGATSATYDAPGPITQTTYFQREVKASVNGTDCYAYSSFVVVFVNNIIPSTIAGNQTLCSNLDPASFTVVTPATGTSLSYQWQSNTIGCAGPWVNIPFATSATYDPPAITQTTYYQVMVTATLNGVSCSASSNCISVISLSKTWNGTISTDWNNATNWTPNGVPDATNCVVIPNVTNDPVISSANAFAYSLTILNGGILNLNSLNIITVTDAVTVNSGGQFTINNNASLVQINNVANSGNITYLRNANNIKGSDYIYWSSPVSNQTLNSIYTTPVQGPKYEWSTLLNNNNGVGSNISQGAWIAAGGTMTTAKGYIVRGSSDFGMAASNINATFTGTPNNGNISINVFRGAYVGPNYTGTNGSTITTLSDNNNLLGNPYPSAINALQFLSDNSSVIEGNVNLWTHGTDPATGVVNPFYGSFAYNYTSNDYVTVNFTGSTNPNLSEIIKSGQAFFVKMLDGPTGNGTVNFNNLLRKDINNLPYANNNFFKSSDTQSSTIDNEPMERHRIWVDIVDSNNLSDRALLGYVTGATLDPDHFYDAIATPKGNIDIYTLIDDESFTIQGRPLPFDENDEVSLGFKTTTSGNFKIAINAIDGLFNTQSIYLKDELLNVYHDLKSAPYSFTSIDGIHNNRFKIVYKGGTLNTNGFNQNQIQISKNNGLINIVSGNAIMSNVKIFDLTGRLIIEKKDVNQNTLAIDASFIADQVLIVAIITTENIKVSKKILDTKIE